MKYSKWKILSRHPVDIVRQILTQRGVDDPSLFVKSDYSKIESPSHMPGISQALKAIRIVQKQGGKIGLFMDYDADGICGGAIIYRALREFIKNLEITWYVPQREEGYGLNQKAIDCFHSQGVTTIITIDCGIKNIEEIRYAKNLGVETIIVDHHQIGKTLPVAKAIIHPLVKPKALLRGKNNRLRFRDYSGGGVAYFLARALSRDAGREKWWLDLAAISSIADMVSLIKDNRTIVKYGLIVLNKTKNLGLKALISAASLKEGKVGVYEVGYMLAPRLNAAGRVSHPEKSFRLLISSNSREAKHLAEELNRLNSERQNMLEMVQKQAIKKVEKEKLHQNKIIILRDDSWSEGIIGLVSSRLSETFWRPSIVISGTKGKLRGSARSIRGIDITHLIGKSAQYLLGFGGHSQAAGLTLKQENYQNFKNDLLRRTRLLSPKYFERELIVDALIDVRQISHLLACQIEELEPFGIGNPRPLFCLERVAVANLKRIGRDQNHIRVEVERSGHSHSAVAFYVDRNGWDIKKDDLIDLVFSIKVDEWGGCRKADLIIEDVKKY